MTRPRRKSVNYWRNGDNILRGKVLTVIPKQNPHFSCKLNEKLILQITRLRDALGEIQKSMQEKH